MEWLLDWKFMHTPKRAAAKVKHFLTTHNRIRKIKYNLLQTQQESFESNKFFIIDA